MRVSVSPGQISEGSDAIFTITVSAAPSQPLAVNYVMGGTSLQNSDYTLSETSQQIVISAGQTSATVLLHAVADHVKERNETASMILTQGTGYKLPKRPKAVLTIVNAP